MKEILKPLLAVLSGGVIVYICKIGLEKLVENAVKSSFEKSIEIFKNNLYRATKAYEILLGREMRFYEKVDVLIAELVPLEQDLLFYLKKDSADNRWNEFRSNFLRYCELTKDLKNETLIHQLYIPEEIVKAFRELVKQMQEDAQFWSEAGMLLYNGEDDKIDYQACEEKVDQILWKVAISQSKTYSRLKDLSGEKE